MGEAHSFVTSLDQQGHHYLAPVFTRHVDIFQLQDLLGMSETLRRENPAVNALTSLPIPKTAGGTVCIFPLKTCWKKMPSCEVERVC